MNRFARVVFLFALLIQQTSFAQSLDDRFGPSEHVRSNRAGGVFFSPRGPDGEQATSSGYRIGDLNATDVAAALRDLQAMGVRAGDLSLTGMPMWSEWSRDFIAEVQSSLGQNGFAPADVRILPHFEPARTGPMGFVERARALFPMRQDLEAPIYEEVAIGIPAVLSSEVTTGVFAFANFQPEIAVPMLVGHFGLLTTMTAFRKTMSNWMARSRGTAEAFAKNGMVSMLFVFNYNVVTRWPEIANDAGREGLGSYLVNNVPAGIADFALTQGPTTIVQTVFFTVTFVNGVFRWEAMTSQTPARALEARRTAAVLTPAIFWVSGPALTWASTSQNVLAQVGPFSFNDGQAALVALTVLGSALWANPALLDHIVRPIQAFVYAPIERAQRALSRLGAMIRPGRGGDTIPHENHPLSRFTCGAYFAERNGG